MASIDLNIVHDNEVQALARRYGVRVFAVKPARCQLSGSVCELAEFLAELYGSDELDYLYKVAAIQV